MALVSMFLCNQSYASHGRDFLLGATILNFNGSDLTHNAAPVGNQPLRLCRGELYTWRRSVAPIGWGPWELGFYM